MKIYHPAPKKATSAHIAQKNADYERNPWLNMPEDHMDHLGFIYLIKNKETGRWYVGRKGFYASAGKRGRTKIRKESDWKSYWGSSKELVADMIKYGKENFSREVLRMCDSKFELMYFELLEQIKHDVVGDPLSYNSILNMRSYIPRKKKLL